MATASASKSPTKRAVPARPDHKRNILLAAERLFADRGFHGVSIRDIADEAGVQFALVGYYYGPKMDLYHEIFRQRSGYIQQRLESLALAQKTAEPEHLLEEIVKAFVLPVLEVARQPEGRYFLRLIQRGMSEQLREDEALIRDMFDPLAHAFIDALADAVPGATRGTAACCYQFALGSLLHHVTDRRIEGLSCGEFEPCAPEVGPWLVRFICGGIRGVVAVPVL